MTLEYAKALERQCRRLRENDPMLTFLDLDGKNVGASGAKALAKALSINKTLQTLILSNNQLGDDGAKEISKALPTNTTLQTLVLSSNQIGDDGAKVLAVALETSTTLQTLNLENNQIGAGGAKALAVALKISTTLQTLHLENNKIGTEGAKALAQALKTNATLKKLYLEYNQSGAGGAMALAQALKTNATLQELYLNFNQIGDDGAKGLAQALEENATIQQLYLAYNQIGPDGANALAHALKTNTSLQVLYLDNNQIGAGGAKALLDAIKGHNSTLTLLNLDHDLPSQYREEIELLVEANKKGNRLAWPALKSPGSTRRHPSTAVTPIWEGTDGLTRKPKNVMLDLYTAERPKQELKSVIEKLSQAVRSLSLQVESLQNSPIKARFKSLDFSKFTASVWENVDNNIVIRFQKTGGDSLLFCDYSIAILNDLNGKPPVDDDLFPYHTVEIPDMSQDLEQILQEKSSGDVDQEAWSILNHIRVVEKDKAFSYGVARWLEELWLWIDPRKTHPGTALAIGRMLLVGNDQADLRSILLQKAFLPPQDRQGDLENDCISSLMLIAMIVEMVAKYDPPEVLEPTVAEISALFVKNDYSSICVKNIQQASLHPHIAYASVKLLSALALAKAADFSAPSGDATGAVKKALKIGEARHSALEAECKKFLYRQQITPPVKPPPQAELPQKVLHVRPSIEPPLAHAELVPGPTPHTEAMEIAQKRYDELVDTIQTLNTVQACSDLYDGSQFQECLRPLRQLQQDFMDTSPMPSVEAREEWAKHWALELSRGEEWAWSLNYCRKAALELLYKVCDICFDTESPVFQELEKVFKLRRINQILHHCLVMDRANCLYNMTDSETNARGLGWYAKGDEEQYQALRDPPLPLNSEGHTMNRRLRWLQRNLYANKEMIIRWTRVAAPERLL